MVTAVEVLSVRLDPTTRTFWALFPLLLLVAAVMAYALFDLFSARQVRYLPKFGWALVIVLGSAPLGALVYLVLGRNPHGTDQADDVSDEHSSGAGPDGSPRVGLTGRPLSRYERGLRL